MSENIPNSERKQVQFNIKQNKVVIETLTCPKCGKSYPPSDVTRNKLGNMLTCPDCGETTNIQAWAANSMKKRFNKVQQDKLRQYSVITLQNKIRAFNTYIDQLVCPDCKTKKCVADITDDGVAYIKCWACGKTVFEDRPDNILTFQGVPVKDIITAMKPEKPVRKKPPVITGPADMEKAVAEESYAAYPDEDMKEDKQDPAASEKQVDLTEVQQMIAETCNEIAALLIEKNRKYGNSALEPVRLFSKAGPIEAIKVRIDDKLSRLLNEQDDEDEDVVKDLMGYLVLLQVAKRMKGAKK